MSVKLKHIHTGVTVSVDEEKAARLGSDWLPSDTPAEPVKRAGRPKKTAEDH